MKRPKGPQLKMPAIKAPAFLADLYYDLRDRRLLPLLALVLVAIAAVPFLLGGDSEEFEAPADGGVIAGLQSAEERAATLTVVQSTPGLRDYRKRLRLRTPTDPFEQRYSSGSLKGAQLNEKKGGDGAAKGETSSKSATEGSTGGGGSNDGSGGGESADGGSTPGGAPPANPSPSPPSKGSDGNGKGGLTFYAFAIDVRIVKTVDGEKQEPIVRQRVLSQTPLPGEKDSVVTFMGAGRDGKKTTGKALMLVAEDVVEVAGDAKCVSGDEICQLLEVEPGFPVVLTVKSGARYTVNVLKLSLVVTGHS